MKVAVIGGDKRMLYAAKAFYDSGFDVSISGYDNLESLCGIEILPEHPALSQADIAVLPVPCVRQGRIFAPYCERAISPHSLLPYIGDKAVFCGMSAKLGIPLPRVFDYSVREDFAYRNAVLTAEGALETAMREYEGSIFGARTLVCGMGRISRILSRYLTALGAQVTVAARKPADRAYAAALGMRTTDFSFAEKYNYDLIFNTVPAPVLHARALDAVGENAVVIDLASAPGGVDFDYAKAHGITAVHALSLPGRCAPAAAGRIIKDTIINIIKEEDGGKDKTGLCDDGLLLHL